MTLKPLSAHDLQLLTTFLSDPDPKTVDLAERRLRSALQEQPECRTILEGLADHDDNQNIRGLLENVRLEKLEIDFRALARQGEDLDLEKGSVLLAQFGHSDVQPQQVAAVLDNLAAEADQRIDSEEGSPVNAVDALRQFMFHDMGFSGNAQNYGDPDNSFINKVLERRLGIPISLSVVYLLVAQRLDIPAQGIGLPGHFIVGHSFPSGIMLIDPFNAGRVLSLKDCEALVRRHGLAFKEEYLAFARNDQILFRMILNLLNAYTELKQTGKARWLAKVLEMFKD